MTHDKDCAWEKADCEYKETHEYCPHPEHACTCTPKEISPEDQVAVLRLKLIGSEAVNVHLKAKVERLTTVVSNTQAALDSYMNAYFNMRDFATDQGLDVTCYHGPTTD